MLNQLNLYIYSLRFVKESWGQWDAIASSENTNLLLPCQMNNLQYNADAYAYRLIHIQ